MAGHAQDIAKRFWSKVDKTDTCWLWTRSANANGYGTFGVGTKSQLAHRVSYEMHVGQIPDGLCVLHRCDVRLCVRPDHLFIGTHLDNMADCIDKGRFRAGTHQRAQTHCQNGHEFDEKNTYFSPQGWRQCRACMAASGRRRQDKRTEYMRTYRERVRQRKQQEKSP